MDTSCTMDNPSRCCTPTQAVHFARNAQTKHKFMEQSWTQTFLIAQPCHVVRVNTCTQFVRNFSLKFFIVICTLWLQSLTVISRHVKYDLSFSCHALLTIFSLPSWPATMAAYAESAASFRHRCTEIGLSAAEINALETQNLKTFDNMAFAICGQRVCLM